jgi:hypothetical protein
LDVRLAGDFESSSVVIDSILEAVPVPVTASKSTRS